ncbi:MAG: carboxypeptidase M32 [Solirubrobacterales bacterium]|nr:carboxypeptidase M32 [Solirubrobacterales bacterium]
MSTAIEQLHERMAELSDLGHASQLLAWDQQTMMPRRGAPSRAESLATLERISHDMFTSAKTGRLIERAAAELDGVPADSDAACLIRVVRRRWEKARRVPGDLAAELARAASLAQESWVAARAASDFAAFRPYLEHNFELARRYVECFDSFDRAYDVLLDDFDPGTHTAEVGALFDELKRELIPVIATLSEHADRVDSSKLHGRFAVGRQRRLALDVVEMMGFDRSGWRIDDAVHPFAAGFGAEDVRITTRWDPHYFPSGLFGAMHECGHGLYDAGIDPSLQRTPLAHAESLALHESQSRLWENMVGRGRPFCRVLAAKLPRRFGDAASGLDQDTLYRAFNRVEPSFIRTEADEATYGLHIVLRFELEQALVEGRVTVAELPGAWNQRFHEYLGLDVVDDADGVLQDVHWAGGLIGYFPTYALGNLIAGQLWERAHLDVPDLDAQISAGEFGVLREWLRENVHRHGAKFSSRDLLQRVVGRPIEVRPFTSYLKRKLGDVYRIAL